MPRLILCADDFALSPEISATIAGLADAGKINAISCMAAKPGWAGDSAMLRGLPRSVETGLHLLLADGEPLTRMPRFAPSGSLPHIDRLTFQALTGRLPGDEIGKEISAQFDRFEQAVGRPPDFVDGHQHSHLLPGIRTQVIAETMRRAPKAWLRDCRDRIAAILARPFAAKALASAAQSIGLAGAARSAGLRTNDGFAGHYDFGSDYAALFPAFLRQPGEIHLVMCHPGAGRAEGDGIAEARLREAAALHSLPIGDMLAAQGLAWSRGA